MNKLVSTTKKLIFYHGIKKVSIEEICKESNVSKVTFYKTFRNKEELVLYILEEINVDAWKKYDKLMEQQIKFQEKMKQLIQFKINWTLNYSKAFISDIMDGTYASVSKQMQTQKEKSIEAFKIILTEGKNNGEFNTNLSSEFILFMSTHVTNSMSDPIFQNLFKNTTEMFEHIMSFFFYGISAIGIVHEK